MYILNNIYTYNINLPGYPVAPKMLLFMYPLVFASFGNDEYRSSTWYIILQHLGSTGD